MTSPPPGQWQPPPARPPQGTQTGSGATKWVLGGLALLAVVALTVVATVLVAKDDSGPSAIDTSNSSTAAPEPMAASAEDRDPAGIILDDPTCQQWTPIYAAFAQGQQNGWHTREPAIPATQWNADQRRQYEEVDAVLDSTADRTVALATETPHRLMRHLYEQFIAYSRTYADAIPTYTADSDHYIRVAIAIADTLNAVCDAISYGAAGARAPLIARAAPTPGRPDQPNPGDPAIFLASANPECVLWMRAAEQFATDTAAWRTIDANIPADQLTPEQRALNTATVPVMDTFATSTQQMGRESDVFVWADIATMSAQYRRAYASALMNYAPADNFLQIAAGSAVGAISEACRAAGA